MAGGTIGTYVDDTTLDILNAVLEVENRPKSQVLGVALRAFLALSPGSRRAMFAIDGMQSEVERDFAMRLVGRAAMKAYDRILESRQAQMSVTASNADLESEEAIEEEASRLCRL
jgi:hypothetical protein